MTDLLFLTPLLPFPTGHGSAMRASIAVEVLAERHRIYVVNTGSWGSPKIFREDWVRDRAANYTKFPAQPDAAAMSQLTRGMFSGAKIEGLYVFRLCMAPLAIQIIALLGSPRPRAVLDLDDDELDSAQRRLPLMEQSGGQERAGRSRAELLGLQAFYKMFLPRFDSILLAARKDRDSLAQRFPQQNFVHLPNVVREPAPVRESPLPGRLLFLGSLTYLPNEDGIVYFCEKILPLLCGFGKPCSVRVAGPGATPRVMSLSGVPEVEIVGLVPDVAIEYARARALIVPLRAGGGTRIKILEAISYKCPVISTTIGAEGLGLRNEEHILIADTPDEFAAACKRLIEDDSLRTRLVESASEWLKSSHTMEHARSVLTALYPW